MTGSSDVFTFATVSESLRGRIEVFTLWPLAQSEIVKSDADLIAWLFSPDTTLPQPPATRMDPMKMVLTGGYPEAVARPLASRRDAWFSSYINTSLNHDARDIARISDVGALHVMLKLLVPRVAQVFNQSAISRESQIPNSTVTRYMNLLEALFIIHFNSAYSSNLVSRAFKSPNIYFTDTGVAGHLIGLDASGLKGNPKIMGHLFENFVVNEIKKQIAWSKQCTRAFHYRSHSGREVDLVLEDPQGRICGIEIKWAETYQPKHAKGLRHLRSQVKERWRKGIVLYRGDQTVPIDETIQAVPVDCLWS